jgi:hypothetical protein
MCGHSRSSAAVDMSAGGMWLHMQDGPRIPHSHLTVSGSASSGTLPLPSQGLTIFCTRDTRHAVLIAMTLSRPQE